MKRKRCVDPVLLWLSAVLLLALALRVYRLDAQSLWYDEAVTAQVAGRGIAELTRWTADDIQPPLYYYVVAGWTRLAGRSEWALRYPSAFFGVLTVALLWAVARRLFPRGETRRWSAGIAALLTATLPLYVYYAQEARMYTLLTFLGVLAGYALLRTAIRSQKSEISGQRSGDRNQGADGNATSRRESGQSDSSASFVSRYPLNDLGRRRSQTACKLAQRGSVTPGRSHFLRGYVSRINDITWWIVFVLASVALLYTHYFGVFLLLAYGLCWFVFQTQRAARERRNGSTKVHEGSRKIILRDSSCAFVDCTAFGLSVVAIIVLYLPWLPAMLNRYRADASYWQGMLKLGEALRHVAINFTVAAPEMMLEGTALQLLPTFGAVLALAVVALFWRGRYVGQMPHAAPTAPTSTKMDVAAWRKASLRDRVPGQAPASRFSGQAGVLLAVLVMPIIAVLFLASRTPKFNPRYLMLASPAYVLLLAGGIAVLWRVADVRSTQFAIRNPQSVIRNISALLLTAFLIATSVVSLRNWFTDPAFTKAQWRELTAFVRAERAPDEAVLLVSGHAYPAWDYYAADIPVLRLPQIEILDVNAVLDFGVAAELAVALADKRGAWLVGWQDEVVDPVGIVPYLLARAGTEQEVPRSFWHLKLRHWQLRPDATFPTEPQPQHREGANFDHKLALLGWDEPVAGQITVYWRVLNTLTRDYQVSVVVEDLAGNRIGQWDGRPAGYDYPTFRWRPGQTLFGRYPLPLPTAAGPGEYIVALTVYDPAEPTGLDIRDIADNPAGKQARLGPVRIEGLEVGD